MLKEELALLDATAQADLVRRREVKPIELVDAAIQRIERLNPTLNAVVTPMYDEGRRVAQGPLPDGPFAGVPFLLKDLTAEYAGARMTEGSAFLKDYVSKEDSELTRRFKNAGLIIVGKTNTPEFGLLPTTEPKLLGPTRNPWDTARTPGGSSGGSAAAVASGMVPAAHGNDGGGSIRIPSSCCGLFGLKTTRGRNPYGPGISFFAQDHALTRSVRDSAALLDAISGPVVGAPYWPPQPERPFLHEVGANPGRLRIALVTTTFTGAPLHPDCVAAVKDAAALCRELGHEVEEATLQIDPDTLVESFTAIWGGECAATIDGWARVTGRTPTAEQFEPMTWAFYEMGTTANASAYILAIQEFDSMARGIARFFERYDLMLTPTLGEPPVPLGAFDSPPEDPMRGFTRAAEFVPYTPLANTTGQPAMSVPLYWNEGGLPIGVHFVARFGDEATLFRIASQLEEARPWAHRRPPVAA